MLNRRIFAEFPWTLFPLFLAFVLSPVLIAEQPPISDATAIYQKLQNAGVLEKGVHLENVVIHRDRVTLTFANGTAYVSPAVAGKVRAAVFIGSGTFQAASARMPTSP